MAQAGNFGFPHTAYPCQEDFMREMYHVLQEGKVGIFESPTGTGKSLSLLCAAFSWLRDWLEEQRAQTGASQEEVSVSDAGSDWVQAHLRKREREEKEQLQLDALEREARRAKRLKAASAAGSDVVLVPVAPGGGGRSRGNNKRRKKNGVDPEDKYALEDELEGAPGQGKGAKDVEEEGSNEHALLVKQGVEDDEAEEEVFKIYFCSRTHSQLAQVVREFRKTCFSDQFRSMSLASRGTLCVNPEVRKLGHNAAVTDRCSELLNHKGEKQALFSPLQTQVLDIEELASLGQRIPACSYYGTRRSKRSCHLVTLPYSSLVNEGTRESLGIQLKGNIVIFDEAHNLVDAINSNHSASLSMAKLLHASEALTAYLERYNSVLSAESKAGLGSLMRWMDALLSYMEDQLRVASERRGGAHVAEGEMFTAVVAVNDFLFQSGIPDVNMFQILRFMKAKQLIRKLNGFLLARKAHSTGVGASASSSSSSSSSSFSASGQASGAGPEDVQAVVSNPMYVVRAFLEALTHPSHDGRISVQVCPGEKNPVVASFVLFNPDSHFRSIVQDARAVILAGGTMHPMEDMISSLLMDVDPSRLHLFSCDHIVPPENVLCLTVPCGPQGQSFKLVHGTRENEAVIRDLGNTIANVCKVVPDGVVCFFPSYGYEQVVWTVWEKSGIADRLSSAKKVFREPRNTRDVEPLLQEYAEAVQAGTGALLSCVVAGKMSEGINFQDRLARCVLVVGMPYPNATDPVLKEQLAYIAARRGSQSFADQAYENMCMKAVNQCIGRAIRHREDYAAILLVDSRYSKPTVRSKLPSWILRNALDGDSYGAAHRALAAFFRGKH